MIETIPVDVAAAIISNQSYDSCTNLFKTLVVVEVKPFEYKCIEIPGDNTQAGRMHREYASPAISHDAASQLGEQTNK